MTRSLLSLLAGGLACLAGALLSLTAIADHGVEVDARLPSGKIASANFQAGKKGQPAVLVLHGFLQTRAFPTVVSVVDAASTAGYTTCNCCIAKPILRCITPNVRDKTRLPFLG